MITNKLHVDEYIKMNELNEYLNILLLWYRDKLDFDTIYTFGVEIEHEYFKFNNIKDEILRYNRNWDYQDDYSLDFGGEAISPILHNTKEDWIDLKNICEIIKSASYVSNNVGSHIHIGMHILGNNIDSWKNFVLLWITYENIINRFLYGEYLSYRYALINNAKPVGKSLLSKLDKINDLDYLPDFIEEINKPYYRSRGINFLNLQSVEPYYFDKVFNKNTVEIRCPNGTLNPIIWQNNINFIMHLFMYAKSSNFNKDIVLRRLDKNKDILSNLEYYDLIYYDQALELCNMIFDDDLDKLYFLRQYLKNNEISHESMVEAKKFTL